MNVIDGTGTPATLRTETLAALRCFPSFSQRVEVSQRNYAPRLAL
jgi:hypothetical protein